MEMAKSDKNNDEATDLRHLPPLDEVLRGGTAQNMLQLFGSRFQTQTARTILAEIRAELRLKNRPEVEISRESLLLEIENRLANALQKEQRNGIKRVINATGVIIHTNLGRAPLPEKAILAVMEESSRYAALEYDLETGKRGKRGARTEELLCELTGAESAIIVNNCAAATFFVLSVLAAGGETIISRGELVEIGGDFRVPDVMAASGTKLVEVGTTNRTKLSDFERAVTNETKVLLRVHPSNFRIIGFTAMPKLAELAELARKKDVILYEDAGSGALFDLSKYGLADEPVISASIKAGVDIITFSGDKLLGACQAGIILGKIKLIQKLRKHPLYRALRLDKIGYSILETTLESYRGGNAPEEIPVLQMIAMPPHEIEKRAKNFVRKLRQKVKSANLKPETLNSAKLESRIGNSANLESEILNSTRLESGIWNLELIKGESAIGGGSAPNTFLETTLIALRHPNLSASALEKKLRAANPPIVARITEEKVLIDLRTVSAVEEDILISALTAIC